jgi:hypothetical protein
MGGISAERLSPPNRQTAVTAQANEKRGHDRFPGEKQDKKHAREEIRKNQPDDGCGLFPAKLLRVGTALELSGQRRRIAELCGDFLLGETVCHFECKMLLIFADNIGCIGNVILFQLIHELRQILIFCHGCHPPIRFLSFGQNLNIQPDPFRNVSQPSFVTE